MEPTEAFLPPLYSAVCRGTHHHLTITQAGNPWVIFDKSLPSNLHYQSLRCATLVPPHSSCSLPPFQPGFLMRHLSPLLSLWSSISALPISGPAFLNLCFPQSQGHLMAKITISQSCWKPSICCPSSKDPMETTWVPTGGWMGKEDVASIYDGILLNHKK